MFAGSDGIDGIYAFGVPAADLGGGGTSDWPGASLPIVPIVVVVLAAAWLVVRLRRRRPA